ncbi:MAG TPA: iron-containing alcohol dehydrogenase [Bacteroidales bacterium]|nr:iron-containing alcohol dehydrogenase [Bacteroidales bacterium]
MNNFEYKNPTKILFGEGKIEKLSQEVSKEYNILLLYGGGSIKKNGVYNQVMNALSEHKVVEFGGIPPNPEYSVLMEALKVIKKEKIDFLLAVGGGSVIDGTKFLSAAALFDGAEPWDIITKRAPINEGMPFGTVLTLPATGSEMNSGFVINREETKEKLSAGGDAFYPQFSILDPEVVKSIPQHQIANGISDAYTHVLEQYMTYPMGGLLQDRFAEGILQTLIEIAPIIMKNPSDYKAASNFMWSCTMALNGLISKGVPEDWATHMMGHELTALFGIDHARTLAILAPNHFLYNFEAKKAKLAQYAERVWNVTEGDEDQKAKAGIKKTEEFFHSLGINTKLSEYTDNYAGVAEEIAKRFTDRGWLGLGENRSLTPQDVKKIVEMSY